jgi:hypothetical protein
MKETISVLFYIKRAKANSKGLVPIFQRITVNGRRIDTSTGKYIDPQKWTVEGAKMKGTSEEARSINSQLDQLKLKVRAAEITLEAQGKEINFETIKIFSPEKASGRECWFQSSKIIIIKWKRLFRRNMHLVLWSAIELH